MDDIRIHSVKLWRRRRRGCILPESNFCSTFSTIPHLSSPYFAFLDFTILYFPLSYFVNYSSSVLPSPATSLYMNSSLTVKGRRGRKVWRSENLPGKSLPTYFQFFLTSQYVIFSIIFSRLKKSGYDVKTVYSVNH